MDKLDPLTRGGSRLTQYLHGSNQNYKALDVTGIPNTQTDILAPCDVEVKGQLKDSLGNFYFEIFNNNFKLQLVHAKVTVPPGAYKLGTVIGTYKIPEDRYPDHLHVAIQVQGVWNCYYDYLRRDIPVAIGHGFAANQQWMAHITSYADRKLVIHDMFPPTPKTQPPTDYDARISALEVRTGSLKSAVAMIEASYAQKGSLLEVFNLGVEKMK